MASWLTPPPGSDEPRDPEAYDAAAQDPDDSDFESLTEARVDAEHGADLTVARYEAWLDSLGEAS